MAFLDIASLKAQSAAQKKNRGQLILVTGVRGEGKSAFAGTTKLPTLLLHTAKEAHGVDSANIHGKGLITSVCLNMDDAGKIISTPESQPDSTLINLFDILAMKNLEKSFGVVVIDSLESLDPYVSACRQVVDCGKDGFKSNAEIKNVWDKILSACIELTYKGVHVILNLPVEMSGDPAAPNFTPVLRGYGSASNILGACPTIIRVTRLVTQNESGENETVHAIHTAGLLSKTKTVKKSMHDREGTKENRSFHLRIAGVASSEVPEYLHADFTELLALIEKKGAK